jgi:hypothetical protein
VANGDPVVFIGASSSNGFVTTSGTSFTIPATGTYLIHFMFMEDGENVLVGGSNPNPTLIQAQVNGTAPPEGIFQFIPPASGTDAPMSGHFLAPLNTGDVISIVNESGTSFTYGAHPANFAMSTATITIIQIQ